MAHWRTVVWSLPLSAVLALLAAPRASHAEESRGVTLAEALAAVSKAPAQWASQLATRAASAGVDAAGAWPETTLSLSTNLRTARFSPALSLPLPIMGTLSAERELARAELGAAREDEAASKLELARRVESAWVELFAAESAATIAVHAAEERQQLARIASQRFDAGDAPQAEVVAAEAEARRGQAEARAAQAAIAAASARLSGALGWPLEAPLHAQGAPRETLELPPLDRMLAQLAQHPGVRAAEARVAIGSAEIELEEHRSLPQLSLELEAAIDDPTLPGSDLRAGVGLSLPVFGRRGAVENAAAARRDAARMQQVAAQGELAALLTVAYRRCEAGLIRVRALRDEVLPAQREAERLARAAYAEGQQGFTAVLQAQRALIEDERELLDARVELALALAELDYSRGGAR